MIGSSTGVICEKKIAQKTEMENNINDESKKTSTRTYYRYTRYLALRLVPGDTLCGSKESTGLRSAGG